MFIKIQTVCHLIFEVHTAKQESDTQNTRRSVSAVLQWTKHNSDGQGWLKRGSGETDV